MFENSLKLTHPITGELLILLGVQSDNYPHLNCLGYVSLHDMAEGTTYVGQDLEDADLFYRVTALVPVRDGWWHFRAEGPAFELNAPVTFIVSGEFRSGSV